MKRIALMALVSRLICAAQAAEFDSADSRPSDAKLAGPKVDQPPRAAAVRRENLKARRPDRPRWMFILADSNGDGSVSEAEWTAFQTELRTRRQELVKKYDRNGNGRLDPEELVGLREDAQKLREKIRQTLEDRKFHELPPEEKAKFLRELWNQKLLITL